MGWKDLNSGDDEAFGIALQSDSKIIMAGYTGLVNPEDDFAVVRINADGTLDITFNPGGIYGGSPNTAGIVTTDISTNDRDQAIDVTIQPDGRILAVGFSRTGGSIFRMALVRYDPDGQLDVTFGGGTGIVTTNINNIDDQARAVAIQSDDKIVVAGWSRTAMCGGYPDQCFDTVVLRYLPDGTLDTAGFNSPNGYVITNVAGGNKSDHGHAVAIQSPGGEIVVGGDTDDPANGNINVLRLNPDGTPDTSWGGTGIVTTDIAGAGKTTPVARSLFSPTA